MDYGFIITRHVNSEQTNKYWNQCVKLIRSFYPMKQIIIIDDNSNQNFINSEYNYKDITVIQSEYPGRGELLPYVYFLKYKWFSSAVIIHDSLFIHKRIPFEKMKVPVLPLWHHAYDKENIDNLNRISSALSHNNYLKKKLNDSELTLLGFNKNKFILCFGAQCYIKLSFLESLQAKYNINNLVNVIHNRTDRCGFERIIGLLFCEEFSKLTNINSLFGDILTKHKSFAYNYNQYSEDFKNKKVIYPFVKVWTGR